MVVHNVTVIMDFQMEIPQESVRNVKISIVTLVLKITLVVNDVRMDMVSP